MCRRRWICQNSEVFSDWVLWRLTPKPRQVWQSHRNDTSLTVHVHNIVARFWERASGDNQWICSKAQMSLGKILITSGQSEAWMEIGESMDGIRCSKTVVSALSCIDRKTLDVLKVHPIESISIDCNFRSCFYQWCQLPSITSYLDSYQRGNEFGDITSQISNMSRHMSQRQAPSGSSCRLSLYSILWPRVKSLASAKTQRGSVSCCN